MTHTATMHSIGMVVHHLRADAHGAAAEIARDLIAAGHDVWVDAAGHGSSPPLDTLYDTRPLAGADLVVSLGGDGTVLRAVHLLAGAEVPILGINSGRLGYLTQAELSDANTVISRYLAGPETGMWSVEERMMIEVVVTTAASGTAVHHVLNEVVVEKLHSGNTVDLRVDIDDIAFTSFATDGLIVATPTGSTAYSLSARGPIVSPRHRAMLLTPVAPHMLFDRTVVLDPSERVDITVAGDRPAALVTDGTVMCELQHGDTVTCCPAEISARFVRYGDRPYHQILKAKFGLQDR